MTTVYQGEGTDLIVVVLFAMRDLDGPGPEGFPYKGSLRGIKEGFNIGRPHFLGVKHPLGVLSGKVLDDRGKRFGTNLVPEHTKLAIGL